LKEKIELNTNAIEMRRMLGENDSSPIDIFNIINALNNITLVFYPMSNNISGLCSIIDNEKLIVINPTLTNGRQRFTIAHELYHLFFQSEFKSVICGINIGETNDVEERNADAFASFLLAPYEALRTYIKNILNTNKGEKITLNEIIKIEQHFGMSHQATLYRLKSDKYITPLFEKGNVIQTARKLGYDDKLYKPTQEGKQYLTLGSYIELTERLKIKDCVSQGKYEEFLLDAFRSDIVYDLDSEIKFNYD
jgi:Zn-dependent peptidase ImmA (M78 family)